MPSLQQQNSTRNEHKEVEYNISAMINNNAYCTSYHHTYNSNIRIDIDDNDTETLSMFDTHAICAYCELECFLNGIGMIETFIIVSIDISHCTAARPTRKRAKLKHCINISTVGSFSIAVAITTTRPLADGNSFFAQNLTACESVLTVTSKSNYKDGQQTKKTTVQKDTKLDSFDFVYDKCDRIGDIWGDICNEIFSHRYLILLLLLLLLIITFGKNGPHLYKFVCACDALLPIDSYDFNHGKTRNTIRIGAIYDMIELEYSSSAILIVIAAVIISINLSQWTAMPQSPLLSAGSSQKAN